jgi:hypothetical protein
MWKKLLLGVTLSSLMLPALASDKTDPINYPLLVIGASTAQGTTPYNNGVAPLNGISVNFGSYLSLGQALTRNHKLPGYVINEAQAGATTFPRLACASGSANCGPAGWDSYQTQLNRALSRVALPPTFTQYNAKYVVITMPNDCLHADAFGIPQNQTQPCSLEQMNGVADRLLSVGQSALAKGVTPIFALAPRYESLDLPLFQAKFGLYWVISEQNYKTMRNLIQQRLSNELPNAVVLDIWREFTHIGDGIHPDPATTQKAAQIIANKIGSL